MRVRAVAVREISKAFRRLDYRALGPIYCDEGGTAFWRAKREPCRRLGLRIARALRTRLRPGGNSLYVGAGVAEIPPLIMESVELGRRVSACNLRRDEVRILRSACLGLPFEFKAEDAARVRGRFDHLWIVSVLNDPEEFPELSSLSYGRSDPTRFRPEKFVAQRRAVRALADRCLRKLSWPAMVTTSIEESAWIEEWCQRRGLPCRAEKQTYPTAIVGDPVCFLHLG
jgi:hypothetical protein